ncbi:bacteriophage protein [Azospirillum thiophilum]|uniref:Bacteriophage protein n=1 Tax=Azospirillum thiophilum TaxID=528244 RepID=A0AAC8W4W7_9PROT|nr:hypothetical protein [Azospirillum thiophilum]ALG75057.1 hypothetical protein AL072_29250 [Azospirillum thiophilum]KJR62449.1 bacteriophage protein [Azospirillum thiophilum]
MAALTNDRNTPERSGGFTHLERDLAASTTIFAGSMVAQNAAGAAVPAAATNTLTVLGRAAHRASTAAGSTLPDKVRIDRGTFRFANSTSTDAITIADYGKPCYAVDDQTVAKTDNSAARPKAGIIRDVDALGVWVEF